MSKNTSRSTFSFFMSLALSATILPACGNNVAGVVTPSGASIDKTTKALTGAGGVTLTPKTLRGTYGANCVLHHGESWDLNLNDPTDKSVEIALNDTFANCPLTLTSMQVQAGMSTVTYPVIPPIVLGLNYAPNPSAVDLAFFTNARLTGLAGSTYTNDFVISDVYSDDALVCKPQAPYPTYAKVTATAQGTSVPPPNYTMGFDSLSLIIDANKVVQNTSSGNVVLQTSMPAQLGEEWRAFDESSMCCGTQSFSEVDAIYKQGHPIATGTISGAANVNINWTSLNLAGQTLPKVRSIIVKHTDGGGVYSYELFQVTFPGPQ